jgi:hypothetical protein
MSDSAQDRPTAFCGYCGDPIGPDSKFCGRCGVSSAAVNSKHHLGPNNRLRNWILIAAAGALGLSVLGGIALQKIGSAAARTEKTVSMEAPTETSPSSPVVPLGDRYVSVVRKGVLGAPYNTTTVGKAFEATFTKCEWKSDETAKGAHFVEFRGQLKPEMYKEGFESTVAKPYQMCLNAPQPENPIKAWYAAKISEQRPCCQDGKEDSSGNACVAMLTGGGFDARGISQGPMHYVITCHDKDGKNLDVTNLTALPREPKPSCGIPPDEVKYSTVTFQFLFAAGDESFTVSYFDPRPWTLATGGFSLPQVLEYIYQ